MARTSLRQRIETLERHQLTLEPFPGDSPQLDEDALAIYTSEAYLCGRVKPDYQDIESTAIYARGRAVRNALYGPIIPVHLDPHIQRYTRASGEFELAFGREPKEGDILCYETVAQMHSSEVYSRHFGALLDAWHRQLPHLPCPLKFEDGRLLRHLASEKRGEDGKWEEDPSIRPECRWLEIPQVIANSPISQESEASATISAIASIVFVGVVEGKYQCRPATEEELQRAETQPPVERPPFFRYGWQRFQDVLVDVMGV